MTEILIYALAIGAAGFMVSGPLQGAGEALRWWGGLIRWITRTKYRSPADWNAAQWWVSKITYLCSKCIAGNLALWFAFFELEPGSGAALVSLSIFFAWAIEKHYG